MTALPPAQRTTLWLLGDERCAGSPSPAMHNAAFGDGRYSVHVDVDADRAFAAAEVACRGVNITAPHKVAAHARYAAVVDDRARAVGAVNTVVYDDAGRATVAANTDVHGLRTAWRRGNVHVEGRVVAVIGAGGAARAVVVAAAEAGARGLVVHARRREAAVSLVGLAATRGLDAAVADGVVADVVVVAASALDAAVDIDAALGRALAPGGTVHELRYGPRAHATRNVALARRALFLDGTSMLLGQAEEAAALFQGSPLSEEQRRAMAAALARSLR